MDWREVEIVPSDQPLAPVRGERLFPSSVYHERGYKGALRGVWLRGDAANRLLWAASLLPGELGLLLWDGWRPIELQDELWREYRAKIERDTGLQGEALDKETQRFVSPPSHDPPPPHLTGGTIDLTLCTLQGVPLAMGGEFDELGDVSRTTHYKDGEFRDNRRLLLAVMTHVGFSNYEEEWWHFDLGNQWHHARVGGPARYGAVLENPEA